jgi:hypothetical protein
MHWVRIKTTVLLKSFLRIGLFLWICGGCFLFAQLPSTINQADSQVQNRIHSSKGAALKSWEIENLAGLARSAPPEVAADILLALASASANDKERSVALIEEAFRIATQVREPRKQRSSGLQVDTRSGFKERAFDLQLDRTSLQSKAVIQMIPLNRVRARNMFEEISVGPIKTLDCKDALIDDFRPYYQAMEAVANECFTDKEKKVSIPAQFVANRIRNIKSLSQITPAEKAVIGTKTSREGLFLLAQLITQALNRVPDDPRSFAFMIERESFVSTTEELISKLEQNNIQTNEFITATRSFLVRNLSGDVCGDVRWIKNDSASTSRLLEALNAIFPNPITPDDIRPAEISSQADNVVYWSTPKAKRIMDAARVLRFGDGTSPLSEQERTNADWHQKLVEFLDLLENWDSNSEGSEDDYFQQRCNMYNLLVELCPDDAQRDVVFRRYAIYLKETSERYKGRIEWILALKDYLRALESKTEVSRKSSLDPWLSSSDTSLQLYAKLAALRMSGNQ